MENKQGYMVERWKPGTNLRFEYGVNANSGVGFTYDEALKFIEHNKVVDLMNGEEKMAYRIYKNMK